MIDKIDAIRHRDKQASNPTNEFRGFGRWAFLEIADPWDAENTIRGALAGLPA